MVFLFIPCCCITNEFSLNCMEHCRKCQDEVADQCEPDTELHMDSNICHCCDKCVYRAGLRESCKDRVNVITTNGSVGASVTPIKCEFGLDCIDDICTHSNHDSYCTTNVDGQSYTYKCDKMGTFYPIECSNYHCWCVNPMNGIPFPKSKMQLPFTFHNTTYCYYMMVTSGVMQLQSTLKQNYEGNKKDWKPEEYSSKHYPRSQIQKSSNLSPEYRPHVNPRDGIINKPTGMEFPKLSKENYEYLNQMRNRQNPESVRDILSQENGTKATAADRYQGTDGNKHDGMGNFPDKYFWGQQGYGN